MMRSINRRLAQMRDDTGATTVIVAIMMTVILGCAALVIDIGAGEARKAQLQDGADAAAIGLAQRCFASTLTMLSGCDAGIRSGAVATATVYATDNVNDGSASVSSVVFTANTVKVTLHSDQPSFFGQVFGVTSSDVNADATAKFTQPAVPLPLAYNKCALPAPSDTATQFLRFDLLNLNFASCGLIGGVTDILSAGWLDNTTLISLDQNGLSLLNHDCSYNIDLVAYVGSIVNEALPINCQGLLAGLIGRQVLLPVYDGVLTDVVINGVLLHRHQVTKYALVEVTGYDFQTLQLDLLNSVTATIGSKNISGPPSLQCPNLISLPPLATVEYPLCQGVQGIFHGYLTPAEAKLRLVGVQLID
jgi:hypothetical protein